MGPGLTVLSQPHLVKLIFFTFGGMSGHPVAKLVREATEDCDRDVPGGRYWLYWMLAGGDQYGSHPWSLEFHHYAVGISLWWGDDELAWLQCGVRDGINNMVISRSEYIDQVLEAIEDPQKRKLAIEGPKYHPVRRWLLKVPEGRFLLRAEHRYES